MKSSVKAALVFLLSSCGGPGAEGYYREGQAISNSLIRELEKVETKEELIACLPRLKRKTNQLAKIMVRAAESKILPPEGDLVSQLLEAEFARICQIEGGAQLIEQAQEEALEILDHFQKQRLKARKHSPSLGKSTCAKIW